VARTNMLFGKSVSQSAHQSEAQTPPNEVDHEDLAGYHRRRRRRRTGMTGA